MSKVQSPISDPTCHPDSVLPDLVLVSPSGHHRAEGQVTTAAQQDTEPLRSELCPAKHKTSWNMEKIGGYYLGVHNF